MKNTILYITLLLKGLFKGLWPFALVLLLLLVLAKGYWSYQRFYPSSSDAELFNHVVPMAPRTTGVVTQVLVAPDQCVKQGQVLLTIDDRQARLDLEKAENNLQIAEQSRVQASANVAMAAQAVKQLQNAVNVQSRQYQRVNILFQKRVMSQESLDQAKQAYVSAKTQYAIAVAKWHVAQAVLGAPGKNTDVESARLALAQAQLNLDDCTLRAPKAGCLTNFNIEKGQTLQANTVVFGVSTPSHWYVRANILEPFLAKVRTGQPVSFSLKTNPGQVYHGVVAGLGHGVAISGWQSNQALPNASPTFQWVTLAKRFPVLIRVTSKVRPNDTVFRFGASVNVTIDTRQAS